MKAIVTLVVLFAIAQSNALTYNKGFDACVAELNLDAKEIRRLHTGGTLPENHEDYVRFMACFWKKIGFLHSNGDVNYDEIRTLYFTIIRRQLDDQASIQRADEIVSECEGIPRETPGLTAIKVGNCLQKASRKNRNEHRY